MQYKIFNICIFIQMLYYEMTIASSNRKEAYRKRWGGIHKVPGFRNYLARFFDSPMNTAQDSEINYYKIEISLLATVKCTA